jgi:hypothetical protein
LVPANVTKPAGGIALASGMSFGGVLIGLAGVSGKFFGL